MKTGIVLALSGLLALSPMVAAAQSQQVAAQPQQSTGTATGGEASGALVGLPLVLVAIGVVAAAGIVVVATGVADSNNNNTPTTTTN